jgi:hypothetical protein
MIPRLAALIQRRARLIADINRERTSLRGTYGVIQQDLVYAGLGLMAGRLLTRYPWLRTTTLAALAIFAGSRLVTKSKDEKINTP